ncbi:MAG: lysophospholipid acyltransferase family protein [Bosea sp. (in: a-proteobacteria)]
MLFLRSLLFNIAYYINVILWMIIAIPTLVMPRRFFMGIADAWARSSLWLLKVIVGCDFELRGKENLPAGGCLLVGKHQSVWETVALFAIFKDPCVILKRELAWIPMFGWYVIKSHMVPIDRKAGQVSMAKMNARAVEAIAAGRQMLIFAEGTRRAPGAPPAYKQGFSHLYAACNAPLVPFSLNSGVFWPRRQFIRRPGKVIMEILPAIPPGLPRIEVQARVQEVIEESSNRLLAEAGWKG